MHLRHLTIGHEDNLPPHSGQGCLGGDLGFSQRQMGFVQDALQRIAPLIIKTTVS